MLTTIIGAATTVIALTVDIDQYSNFLYLIGAVFIPLSGALVAGWLRTGGVGWDTSDTAPIRPGMLAAWGSGFVAYQLINPWSIAGRSDLWTRAAKGLHTMGHPWLSASMASFVVAVLVALPFAAPKTGQLSPRQAESQNIHS